MPRSPEQIRKRNAKVVEFFTELEKKHPEWRMEPLMEETAKKFFLTIRTVQHILQHHGGKAEHEERGPDLFTDFE